MKLPFRTQLMTSFRENQSKARDTFCSITLSSALGTRCFVFFFLGFFCLVGFFCLFLFLSWIPNPSQILETDSDGPCFLPTALPPGWAQEKKKQNLKLPHFPGPHRPVSGWGQLCGQSQVGRALICVRNRWQEGWGVPGGLGERRQLGHQAQVPPVLGPFIVRIDGLCIS